MSDQNTAQQLHAQIGAAKTITLIAPVTLGGGERIESLTVRALTIGDVRAAAHVSNDLLRELFILSRLTGLVPEDLDLLHFVDYQQLQEMFRL